MDVPKPYLAASPMREPPVRVEFDSYWPGPGMKDPTASKRFDDPKEYCAASPIGPVALAVSTRGE